MAESDDALARDMADALRHITDALSTLAQGLSRNPETWTTSQIVQLAVTELSHLRGRIEERTKRSVPTAIGRDDATDAHRLPPP